MVIVFLHNNIFVCIAMQIMFNTLELSLMKKVILFCVFICGLFFISQTKKEIPVSIVTESSYTLQQTNVAWAIYEICDVEEAAAVGGTGTAIAVDRLIRGAKWGARIGKYAGFWGALAGAAAGAL